MEMQNAGFLLPDFLIENKPSQKNKPSLLWRGSIVAIYMHKRAESIYSYIHFKMKKTFKNTDLQ